jgi:hypothetical protein
MTILSEIKARTHVCEMIECRQDNPCYPCGQVDKAWLIARVEALEKAIRWQVDGCTDDEMKTCDVRSDCDVGVLCAALAELEGSEELEWLKEIAKRAGYQLDVVEVCRATHVQNCTACPRLECCDNLSMFSPGEVAKRARALQEIERLRGIEEERQGESTMASPLAT